MSYTTVVMPVNPNLDKLAMYLMLKSRSKGTEHELSEKHKIGWFSTGALPEGISVNNIPDTVFLDCAGGPFDGHGNNKEKAGIELVADALGMLDSEPHTSLIRRIAKQDKEGRRFPGEIGNVIMNAYRMGREFPEVLAWTKKALDAITDFERKRIAEESSGSGTQPWYSLTIHKIREVFKDNYEGDQWLDWGYKIQKESMVKIREAQKQLKKERFCSIPTSGRKVNLAVLSSDNPWMTSFAFKEDVDVVVSRLETIGTTMIALSNKAIEDGISLRKVVLLLRRAEAQKRGLVLDKGNLDREGKYPGLELWHVHEKGPDSDVEFFRIYNGTEQHPDVEPTKLSLEEIKTIVIEGLKKPEIAEEDHFLLNVDFTTLLGSEKVA